MRKYVVTGIPKDGQEKAALHGRLRAEQRQLRKKESSSVTGKGKKHRVSGQIVCDFVGREAKLAANEFAESLQRDGYTVTVKRKTVSSHPR